MQSFIVFFFNISIYYNWKNNINWNIFLYLLNWILWICQFCKNQFTFFADNTFFVWVHTRNLQWRCSFYCKYTHTHTQHTRKYTYTHTIFLFHTHRLFLSLTHTHIHTLSHILPLSLKHTQSLSRSHTHTYSFSCSLSHAHMHTYTPKTARHMKRMQSKSKPLKNWLQLADEKSMKIWIRCIN